MSPVSLWIKHLKRQTNVRHLNEWVDLNKYFELPLHVSDFCIFAGEILLFISYTVASLDLTKHIYTTHWV
jgi:hypothetical protein